MSRMATAGKSSVLIVRRSDAVDFEIDRGHLLAVDMGTS